MSIITFRINNK